MKSEHILGPIVALAAVAAVLVVTGVGPTPHRESQAHPPCGQLPATRQVARAIAAHPDLVSRIERVGPDVEVGVGTPCAGKPDQALVQIDVATDDQRREIDYIFATDDGFGVPALLTTR